MKKVLAICLTLVMVLSMGLTALAAPNGFVSSPSGKPGPGIVDFESDHEDCPADLIITPFGDRENLPEPLRDLFETAYDIIVNATDLLTLVGDLKDLVDSLGIDGSDLAVGDFFVIHSEGCDYHGDSVNFEVTVKADGLQNFVGLIVMNEEGKWELVRDAQVVNNGTHLKFTVNSFAPYALIMDASAGSLVAPQTGYAVACVCAVVMVASAVAFFFVMMKRKKAEA